jgi:hypothetical protein
MNFHPHVIRWLRIRGDGPVAALHGVIGQDYRHAAWLQHRGKRHRPSVTTFADPISFSQRLLSDHDLADFGHCQARA